MIRAYACNDPRFAQRKARTAKAMHQHGYGEGAIARALRVSRRRLRGWLAGRGPSIWGDALEAVFRANGRAA